MSDDIATVEAEDAEVVEDDAPLALTEQAMPAKPEDVDVFRSMYKLAAEIAPTEFVPASLRGKPSAVLACFMMGREVGLGPMASLKHVQIIDGRPNFSAEFQLAKVRGAGHRVEGGATNERAEVIGTRADTGETMTVVWDLNTALTAGLVDKVEDGKAFAKSRQGRAKPWESYTHSMLWARAVTQLVRQLFPDVLIGGGE